MHTRARSMLVGSAAAVVLASLVSACSSSDGAPSIGKDAPHFRSGSVMAKIQKSGELTVGVKYDVPLFGQKNPMTGHVEGFEVDLAKMLGRDMFGVDGHVRFVEAPGPVREQMVTQGKADLVSSTYTITPERAKEVAFAGPIYYSLPAVLVRKNYQGIGETIQGYGDLNGHTVCAVTDSIEADLIKQKAPQAHLIQLTGNSECAKALDQQRVDAFASDDVILFAFVKSDPGKYRFVDNPDGLKQPYGIGIRKSSLDLCNWVNGELRKSFEDGEWAKIYKETVGQVVDRAPTPPKPSQMKYCR